MPKKKSDKRILIYIIFLFLYSMIILISENNLKLEITNYNKIKNNQIKYINTHICLEGEIKEQKIYDKNSFLKIKTKKNKKIKGIFFNYNKKIKKNQRLMILAKVQKNKNEINLIIKKISSNLKICRS